MVTIKVKFQWFVSACVMHTETQVETKLDSKTRNMAPEHSRLCQWMIRTFRECIQIKWGEPDFDEYDGPVDVLHRMDLDHCDELDIAADR